MVFPNIPFPFTAIVGQEKMKRALIINAINPSIGGLLIKGERGTGKSTAARALSQLLPEIEVVADCPFSCHPHDINQMCENCANRALVSDSLKVETRKVRLVELPLNVSEDRLVGTIDIEKVLKRGEKQFEPGVLARANRSILYIDEVNLLDDHIVDLLLDAAAMGVNVVEREGVSFSHPARFIMIGTMNPEEGELRPQLEDRFGLCVNVQGERDFRARAEIVRKMRSFQDNPLFFVSEHQEAEEALRGRILRAQKLLDKVELPDAMLELITFISVELKVCGHRADITMMNAAITLAALDEKGQVEVEHVREAAELSLLHRLRRDPFEEKPADISRIDEIIEEKQSHHHGRFPQCLRSDISFHQAESLPDQDISEHFLFL
ncbi:MAG: ATP-binding protein [Candidatus Hadarchaeum sp.]